MTASLLLLYDDVFVICLTLKVVKLNAQAQLLAGSSVTNVSGNAGIGFGGGGTGGAQALVFRLPDF